MWRVLIQLPSLISEVIGHLRTLSYLMQQQLLLQQEANLLLRELIIKVTTQPAETAPAVTLDKPPMPTPSDLPLHRRRDGTHAPGDKKSRVLTEHDIIRNTRTTIAEEQFKAKGLEQFPHRRETLPTSPRQSPDPANPTPPLGTPPGL